MRRSPMRSNLAQMAYSQRKELIMRITVQIGNIKNSFNQINNWQ